MKRYFTILILLITAGFLSAQEVTFYTQAPRQVNIGQRFYLTFTINQEGIGFIGPEIQHFDVLSGPSVQTSSQIQNVNGKITQSTSYSYTFILAANEAGTFTIPPAIITVKGKRYQSNTVTINVNGQGGNQAKPGQPSQRSNAQSNDNSTGNDIFLKAICDKSNPYLGEQIIVTYKLYTPTNRLRINPASTAPAYPGFWAQDLMKDAQQYPQYNEVINGKKYIVAEIRKEALFPQKSGPLTITPFEQEVVYSVKVKGRSPFSDDPFFSNDPFFKSFFDDSNFGYEYQNVEKTLKSNAVTINVKPLPQQNKPINFTGAVGQFSLKPNLDRTELKANEAITLKLTISGTGNLSLIEKPDINFPPDFEVYDPKITDNIHSTSSGISGSRTFEYLIIPRTAGDFKIAPVQFAYFDLSKKDYVTLSSPEYSIKVLKGDGTSANAMTTVREDVKYVGSDIRHLKETPLSLKQIGSHFYGSWLFWLLFSLPAFFFLLFIILWRNHIRMNADLGSVRKRKATRIATMRLKKAKSLLSPNTQEAFYVEISQALWGYISDKFNVPLSELSMDTAADRLTSRNVEPQLIQQFIDTLEHCEYARFAPGDKEKNMEKLYSEAIDVITHTEEQLK
ncbi:MAG: protein BatD [Bacteroidales bacterium]|nr:protein BatD [Bacteroidales bacterium]